MVGKHDDTDNNSKGQRYAKSTKKSVISRVQSQIKHKYK